MKTVLINFSKNSKIAFVVLFSLIFQINFGQTSGNINYKNQVRYSENATINFPATDDIFISVKGIANIKATSFVAIFSLTQSGKTTEEVNELFNKRLNQSLAEIKQIKGVETYIDMVSFVPIYEFEVEKKLFTKKTYNEIPKGFELKKNLHIKYSDPNQLNDFLNILSNQEIYDLVRVDYFSESIESVKKDLINKAKVSLLEKIKHNEALLGISLASFEKKVNDQFKVMLPVEMYQSYQAFGSSSINLRKSANINEIDKTTTQYYQPILDKEFDFVINPVILEPVIQVMYEIKMVVNREKKPTLNSKEATQNNKEYLLITPSGEVKTLNINK